MRSVCTDENALQEQRETATSGTVASNSTELAAEPVDEAQLEADFRERYQQNLVEAEEVVKSPTDSAQSHSESRTRTFLVLTALLGGIVVAAILATLIPRSKDKNGADASSLLPELSRMEQFQALLAPHVSDPSLWEDTSSPQFQALDWIVNQDELVLVPDFSEAEDGAIFDRYAAMVLFYSTDGPNWHDTLLFGSNYTTCEWPKIKGSDAYSENFIECDDDDRVARIRIDNNLLNGTIPGEISLMSHLNAISLVDDANLRGPIPSEIGKLAESLVLLQIAFSSISGVLPTEMSLLTNMQTMHLGKNRLEGEVPDLSAMTNLQNVLLGGNLLEGTLPEINSEASLIAFEDNFLEGSIPKSYWKSTNLQIVSLSNNLLTGSLPSDVWDDLQIFELLYLERNQLSGTLPKEMGNLAFMFEFHLAHNPEIIGSIPSEWGNMRRMMWLDISGLSLTGTLPSEFGQLQQLVKFDLYSNSGLTGTIPIEWAEMSSLTLMWIHDTAVTGGFEDAFCAQNDLTTSIRADCGNGEVSCSCCTACCTDSDGDGGIFEDEDHSHGSSTCEVKLDAVCDTQAVVFELEGMEQRNTTCNCLNNGTLVECTDQACPACNLAGDLCAISTRYGYRFDEEDGGMYSFQTVIKYVSERYKDTEIAFETNTRSDAFCAVWLNGEKCRHCDGIVCASGFQGWFIECDNVEGGGNHNTCQPLLEGQGPLEIFSTYDEGLVSGCPLVIR